MWLLLLLLTASSSVCSSSGGYRPEIARADQKWVPAEDVCEIQCPKGSVCARPELSLIPQLCLCEEIVKTGEMCASFSICSKNLKQCNEDRAQMLFLKVLLLLVLVIVLLTLALVGFAFIRRYCHFTPRQPLEFRQPISNGPQATE